MKTVLLAIAAALSILPPKNFVQSALSKNDAKEVIRQLEAKKLIATCGHGSHGGGNGSSGGSVRPLV